MKKASYLAIVISLLLTLTGCDYSDYKSAEKMMRSGDYSGAIEIYQKLGDYKDSAQRITDAKWEMIFEAFPRDDGGVPIYKENFMDSDDILADEYHINALLDRTGIVITRNNILLDSQIVLTIYKNNTQATLNVSWNESEGQRASRTTELNLEKLSKEQFEAIESFPFKPEGTDGFGEMLMNGICRTTLEKLPELLESNCPDITMQDLGFSNY